MQSSANPSGGADARRVSDIDPAIVAEVDLVLDVGELDGTASTVIDLRTFEVDGGVGDPARGRARARARRGGARGPRRRKLPQFAGAGWVPQRARWLYIGADMVIAIGSDHAGFHLKEHVKRVLAS